MRKHHFTLVFIGAAISIAQFVMIRDFVSILYGEEVVIILVAASFFLGLSVGYALALSLSVRLFQSLFVGSVFLHLTFPFSYRYLAAWLSAGDAGGYWFLVLLFCYALLFNTIFATFLPRLIALSQDTARSESRRLPIYYGLELAGFMIGFSIVALSWNRSIGFLLVPYWLILGLILHLTLGHRIVTAVYASLALLVGFLLPRFDYHSSAMLYAHKHHIRGARVLFSVNSPYQKVEVVENTEGNRYLYLDGLQNLNSSDLTALNYYIAQLPAALIRPNKTLLVGNGSLASIPSVYPYSGDLTTVELDSGVLEAGRRFFTRPEQLIGLDRWQLHVDDGKHFLRRAAQQYDLIVIDVPSPLTIQEAYLHAIEFYRLVRERLTAQGVVAVQLSGPLQKNNRTPARVTAALRAVFPEVLVIHSRRAGRGFAYASMDLPFSESDLRNQAKSYEKQIRLISPGTVDQYLQNAVALSVDTMDLVLRRGWERFASRYLDD